MLYLCSALSLLGSSLIAPVVAIRKDASVGVLPDETPASSAVQFQPRYSPGGHLLNANGKHATVQPNPRHPPHAAQVPATSLEQFGRFPAESEVPIPERLILMDKNFYGGKLLDMDLAIAEFNQIWLERNLPDASPEQIAAFDRFVASQLDMMSALGPEVRAEMLRHFSFILHSSVTKFSTKASMAIIVEAVEEIMTNDTQDDSVEAFLLVIQSVMDIHLRIAEDANIPKHLRLKAVVDVTLTMLKQFLAQGTWDKEIGRLTMAQRFAIYVFTWGPERKWRSQYGEGGHLHDIVFKEAYPVPLECQEERAKYAKLTTLSYEPAYTFENRHLTKMKKGAEMAGAEDAEVEAEDPDAKEWLHDQKEIDFSLRMPQFYAHFNAKVRDVVANSAEKISKGEYVTPSAVMDALGQMGKDPRMVHTYTFFLVTGLYSLQSLEAGTLVYRGLNAREGTPEFFRAALGETAKGDLEKNFEEGNARQVDGEVIKGDGMIDMPTTDQFTVENSAHVKEWDEGVDKWMRDGEEKIGKLTADWFTVDREDPVTKEILDPTACSEKLSETFERIPCNTSDNKCKMNQWDEACGKYWAASSEGIEWLDKMPKPMIFPMIPEGQDLSDKGFVLASLNPKKQDNSQGPFVREEHGVGEFGFSNNQLTSSWTRKPKVAETYTANGGVQLFAQLGPHVRGVSLQELSAAGKEEEVSLLAQPFKVTSLTREYRLTQGPTPQAFKRWRYVAKLEPVKSSSSTATGIQAVAAESTRDLAHKNWAAIQGELNGVVERQDAVPEVTGLLNRE